MNKEQISNTCPAKCKDTGKCYGKAFFLGQPGKSKRCDFKCKFITGKIAKEKAAQEMKGAQKKSINKTLEG
jgi:hypothetical protein